MTKIKSNLLTSLIVILGLLLVSILFEEIFGIISLEFLQFPVNLYLILELIILIFILDLIFKKARIIRWLSSTTAALSSIFLFSLLVVPMAVTPQQKNSQVFLNLNQITHTWMFAIASLFLIIVLGFTIMRRSFPFRSHNILFFVNHFGLWIVLTAGLLGTADMQELKIKVYEGQVASCGQNEKGEMINLPIAFKLDDFVMRNFPPKIALINLQGKPYPLEGKQLHETNGISDFKIAQYQIHILQYFPEAHWDSIQFISKLGSQNVMPAAQVTITTPKSELISGWISSGNYMENPTVIELGKDTLLTLLPPEPEYFGSKVTLYSKPDNSAQEKIISVNNPACINGWSIYQYSYDMKQGNNSKYSVFLLVKDPWLPLVYFGMFLLIIGSILLLLVKTQRKEGLI